METLQIAKDVGLCNIKPFISIKHLELNKKYKVIKFEKIKGKFGPTILAELEDGKLNLPKRFVKTFDDKVIKDLNKQSLNMIIKEFKTFQEKDTPIIDFVED